MGDKQINGPIVQVMMTWIVTKPVYLIEEFRLRNLLEELVNSLEMSIILPTIGVRLPIRNYKDIFGREPKVGDYGYSFVTLIAESHIAVHTWPEFNKAFLEVASCKEFDTKVVQDIIDKLFPGAEITSKDMVM